MARTTKNLTTNVTVEGTTYGPDYPENELTAEVRDQITNPAAFEDTTTAPDNRVRADDFAEDDKSSK
jgi:hypothetical protein